MSRALLTRRLFTIYITAVLIVIVLITGGQAIIQATLLQEVNTRNLAFMMSRQTLRSQRLLRNSILVYAGPNDKAFNPPNINPTQQLQSDLDFVEVTNKQLIDPAQTPEDVAKLVQTWQSDFQSSDRAGHKLLADTKQYFATKRLTRSQSLDATTQLAAIFVHDQNYLVGIYGIYNTISMQADEKVWQVQITEISIYLISLLVLAYEVFAVVLPSLKAYTKALQELEEVEQKIIAEHATPEDERGEV